MLHLAMGDIFRSLDKATDLGREFLSYATKGLLVPDELTIRAFRQHVDGRLEHGTYDPAYHTLILDGIPRTPAQVDLLADVIDVKRIVHLVIDDNDVIIARLRGRAAKADRPDDADVEVIRTRIQVYERETSPVIDKYPNSLVARVNADQPPLAVLRDVADCLVTAVPAKV